MSDDTFDDGLVHSHHWSHTPKRVSAASYPIANVVAARVPSTTANDEQMYRD